MTYEQSVLCIGLNKINKAAGYRIGQQINTNERQTHVLCLNFPVPDCAECFNQSISQLIKQFHFIKNTNETINY